MDPITLYGSPMSLYTGRARSYLIKAGIDYREEPHASAHYMDVVLPRAGGRRGIPTIEFPDGRVIRDGVAIIDHFENERGHPHSPTGPRQRIVSRLLDVLGAEGLLRPAMHYRWNFPEQEEFLRHHFAPITPVNALPEQTGDARMKLNRTVVTPLFGVAPDGHALIESLYGEFLRKLDAHLQHYPYLLGGKPCIGDFGLIAPMYGHLGRDPKPLSLMQTQALHVLRWVERMNRPEPDAGEYANREETFLEGDVIPGTLIALLKHVAIDFVPETRAAAGTINAWLAANTVAAGTECERGMDQARFAVGDVHISALAQPFRFFLLARVQEEFGRLEGQDRQAVLDLLDACEMRALLDMKLTRGIVRANNLEVWE